MKKIAAIAVSCLLYLGVLGQVQQNNKIDTAEREKHWAAWLNDLYDVGVVLEKDSIKLNNEARRIIADSNYRKLIYPRVYTWPAATYLLKAMELKKGFWYLINLYSADTANKKLVIEALVPFDQTMDMEKVMISTFYTYAMLDPKVCTISKGKPVIKKPDIVEKEFGYLKEIIAYIEYYRKQRKDK
jgi:hypothetical protein